MFLSILCSIKIERLLFLKFLRNLAFFDSYFWPFNKTHEKIIAIFVISAIMASNWYVFWSNSVDMMKKLHQTPAAKKMVMPSWRLLDKRKMTMTTQSCHFSKIWGSLETHDVHEWSMTWIGCLINVNKPSYCNCKGQLKLRYYEKATKFEKNLPPVLTKQLFLLNSDKTAVFTQ